MFLLAWRQALLDPIRTGLTSVALGSVMAIIFILSGFEQGQYYQLKEIVLKRNADLIVTQSGVSNFIAVRSSIPQLARAEIEEVNGVINAHPLTAIPVIYNKNNIRTPVYVLVYDTRGGPSSIIEGRNIRKGREIVIDKSLARKYNLGPGDSFRVTDFEFRIVGVTREAAFMMPFAFINYDSMLDLFIESEIAPDLSTFPLLSYMLIELDPAVDKKKIAKEIESHVPSVDVFLPEQLARNDVKMGEVFFGPVMGLLVSIGYVIGMLVVSLVMYADIRARIKSFAVLKALGFSLGRLFLTVLVQSLLLFVMAVPIGILLASGISFFIEMLSPVYYIQLFSPVTFSLTLGSFLIFAFIGALIPVRTIHQTDPVIAFQVV